MLYNLLQIFGNKYFEIINSVSDKQVLCVYSFKDFVVFIIFLFIGFFSLFFYKTFKELIDKNINYFVFQRSFSKLVKESFLKNNGIYEIFSLLIFIITSIFLKNFFNLKVSVSSIFSFLLGLNLIKRVLIFHFNLIDSHVSKIFNYKIKITNFIIFIFTLFLFIFSFGFYDNLQFLLKIWFIVFLLIVSYSRLQIIISIENLFLKFLIILYLCTFEILPFLVGFKWLIKN